MPGGPEPVEQGRGDGRAELHRRDRRADQRDPVHVDSVTCEPICEMPIETCLCSWRMTVELRHLRSFLAIADEGNITEPHCACTCRSRRYRERLPNSSGTWQCNSSIGRRITSR